MRIRDFPAGEVLKSLQANNPPTNNEDEQNKKNAQFNPGSPAGFENGKNGNKENGKNKKDVFFDNIDNIRQSGAYKTLRRMVENGETSIQDLEFLSETDSSVAKLAGAVFNNRSSGKIDHLAARVLLKDIKSGELSVAAQPRRDESRDNLTINWAQYIKENSSETDPENIESISPRRNDIYEFLCQEYVKGMTLEQMEQEFTGKTKLKSAPEAKPLMSRPEWRQMVSQFGQDVKAGYNPAARVLTNIIINQPGLKEFNLEQADWEQVSSRLIDGIKSVWQDFYYSGKWRYNQATGEYELTKQADLDACVSMYLFKKAGLKKILDAKPLPPGKIALRGTILDLGGIGGVKIEKYDTGKPSVVIDNHQPGRGFETSSAQIIHNLLSEGGWLKSNYQLRALVEMTVADDNARLIQNKEQFERSSKTMRGLYRFCSPEKIIEYFSKYWLEESAKFNTGDKGRLIYQSLLDRELTQEDIKELHLTEFAVRHANTVKRAKEMLFDVGEDELVQQGRLINTRLGKAVVNIESPDKNVKKFKGGHDAVAADPRGFKLFLSYDPAADSILLNTTDRKIDLYEEFKPFLEKHQDLVSVRGALLIKPRDGKPLSFELEDLLAELGYDISQAQGQVKEFLHKKTKEPKPVESAKTTPSPIEVEKKPRQVKVKRAGEEETIKETAKIQAEKTSAAGKAMEELFARPLNDKEKEIKVKIDKHIGSQTNKDWLESEADKYLNRLDEFKNLTAAEQTARKEFIVNSWLEEQHIKYYQKYNLPLKE